MARTSGPAAPVDLGSLTQPGARRGTCLACGSARVTRIGMNLTDGTPVDFTSCLECEHRSWQRADGTVLSRDDVLLRTARTR